jgi:hypothetical protein
MSKEAMTKISLPPSTRAGTVVTMVGRLPRGEFFAGLLVLACVNGLSSRITDSINRLGLTDAFFNTFDVSVIAWISCCAGVTLVLRDRTGEISLLDFVIGAGILLLVILPVNQLSWIAVAALCTYMLASNNIVSTRQGALILLATTVPMLWSRLVFKFFANPILNADASLVSWLLGTRRTGNIIEFADNSGHLVILAPCSSLANVSLAILCWVSVSQLANHRRSPFDVIWCLCACASVVAVNVTRMAMMGLTERDYVRIHSNSGDALTNMIICVLAIGICLLGVRRELFARV